MRNGLIGGSGFIGGHLLRGGGYAASFHSRDIADIDGQHFDRLVCAGAPGVKYLANRDPDADWASIQKLWTHLARARAARVVLISTVDVYPQPAGVDEADAPGAHSQAYGRHRRWLEEAVAGHFPHSVIVRLPGMFGPGLRKNAVFDLLHRHEVEKLPGRAALQWYPLERLAGDLETIEAAGIGLINIAPPPMAMAELAARLAPEVVLGEREGVVYDIGTRHAALLGGAGRYHLSLDEVRARLDRFAAEVRR